MEWTTAFDLYNQIQQNHDKTKLIYVFVIPTSSWEFCIIYCNSFTIL